MIVKLLSQEQELTGADDINEASVVRVFATNDATVTRRNSANTVLGSCYVPSNSITFFEKNPTDTLEATAQVNACSVAYTIS